MFGLLCSLSCGWIMENVKIIFSSIGTCCDNVITHSYKLAIVIFKIM